jgi:predicted ester cyclase
MPAGDNKTIVRRFYAEVIGAGDLSRVEAFVGPEYLDHNAEEAGRGPSVVRAHVQALRRTFPDFQVQIDDVIAEGDKVVTRVSGRGTHGGEWMGILPTGAVVRVKGINIDRIADGHIVEHWGEADTVGMLLQMGVDPFAGRRNA